jgi:hypothetical protein
MPTAGSISPREELEIFREHLAEAEISALFEQCNTTKPEVREIRPAA